jgi:hypothetical protein
MSASSSLRFAGVQSDDDVYLEGSDVVGLHSYTTADGIHITGVQGWGWVCGVYGHPVDVGLRLALRPREVRGEC